MEIKDLENEIEVMSKHSSYTSNIQAYLPLQVMSGRQCNRWPHVLHLLAEIVEGPVCGTVF